MWVSIFSIYIYENENRDEMVYEYYFKNNNIY